MSRAGISADPAPEFGGRVQLATNPPFGILWKAVAIAALALPLSADSVTEIQNTLRAGCEVRLISG